MGNVTEVEDIKKLISAEELHKDKLNSYKSAKMHLYEISVIKGVDNDDIKKVSDAMMERYGIENKAAVFREKRKNNILQVITKKVLPL